MGNFNGLKEQIYEEIHSIENIMKKNDGSNIASMLTDFYEKFEPLFDSEKGILDNFDFLGQYKKDLDGYYACLRGIKFLSENENTSEDILSSLYDKYSISRDYILKNPQFAEKVEDCLSGLKNNYVKYRDLSLGFISDYLEKKSFSNLENLSCAALENPAISKETIQGILNFFVENNGCIPISCCASVANSKNSSISDDLISFVMENIPGKNSENVSARDVKSLDDFLDGIKTRACSSEFLLKLCESFDTPSAKLFAVENENCNLEILEKISDCNVPFVKDACFDKFNSIVSNLSQSSFIYDFNMDELIDSIKNKDIKRGIAFLRDSFDKIQEEGINIIPIDNKFSFKFEDKFTASEISDLNLNSLKDFKIDNFKGIDSNDYKLDDLLSFIKGVDKNGLDASKKKEIVDIFSGIYLSDKVFDDFVKNRNLSFDTKLSIAEGICNNPYCDSEALREIYNASYGTVYDVYDRQERNSFYFLLANHIKSDDNLISDIIDRGDSDIKSTILDRVDLSLDNFLKIANDKDEHVRYDASISFLSKLQKLDETTFKNVENVFDYIHFDKVGDDMVLELEDAAKRLYETLERLNNEGFEIRKLTEEEKALDDSEPLSVRDSIISRSREFFDLELKKSEGLGLRIFTDEEKTLKEMPTFIREVLARANDEFAEIQDKIQKGKIKDDRFLEDSSGIEF